MVDFVNFVWQRFLESKCQRQRWMIWEAMCLSPRFLDFLVLGFYFGHFDMLCSAMHDVWGMTACMMLNLWLCGWPQKIQSNRIIKELVTGKLVTIRLLDYDYYLMVIRFQFVNSQQLQGLVYLQLYKTVLSPENKKYAVMQSWSQRLKEIIRNHLESFVRRIYLNKIHTIRFHFRILEIQKTPPTTHPPELPPSTTLTCWRLASAAVSFKPMSLSHWRPALCPTREEINSTSTAMPRIWKQQNTGLILRSKLHKQWRMSSRNRERDTEAALPWQAHGSHKDKTRLRRKHQATYC